MSASASSRSRASSFPFVSSVYKEVQDLLDARARFEEAVSDLLKVRDQFVLNLSFTFVQKTNTGRVPLEDLRADADTLVDAIARSSENSSSLPSSALAPLVVLRESVHGILDTKPTLMLKLNRLLEECGGFVRTQIEKNSVERFVSRSTKQQATELKAYRAALSALKETLRVRMQSYQS